jgi:hypothetical protein
LEGDTINKGKLSLGASLILRGLAIALMSIWALPDPAGAAECPNEAFRTGPSAELPDCRAYELVTPPDSNGRLLEGFTTFGFDSRADMFPTELGSPTGDSFLYQTHNGPMPSPEEAAGTFDRYQAVRSDSGWATVRLLTPPGDQAVLPYPGGASRDHEYTFTQVSPFVVGGVIHPGGSLAPKQTADYLSSPDGSFELVGIGSLGSERLAQGRYISEGGEHVIFVTGIQSLWCSGLGEPCSVKQLEPDAPPTGTGAVYDRSADGPTQVVSLLPGNVTPAAGESAFYQGASKDASSIAFVIEGTLYVRIDNEETLEVASGEPTYAGLSDDGHYLFYVAGGNIHRFDTETEEDDQVNSTGDAEVANVSADGSHVYFISKSQIGGEGEAGQPNMYVWSGGASEFVATVDPADTTGLPALTNWTSWVVSPQRAVGVFGGPGGDSSRTTPDGTVLAFESHAQLSPYDNDGHTEIYRYDDGDKSLVCVSCSPSVEPATADARFQELERIKPAMVIHNLSADGSRVFFETPEALVARDTDGINDIYQGHEQQGGVISVDLISTGQSVEFSPLVPNSSYRPAPNILFSVTPDGGDIFFMSLEKLVPAAGGGSTQAIYDARVNGGFAEPVPPQICVEEGCKGPLGAPLLLPDFPQSESTQGAGNVQPPKRKPHCQRPKHKKHKHCKKKKGSQERTRAATSSAQEPDEASEGQAPATDVSSESPPEASEESTPSVSLTAAEEFPFGIELFEASESSAAAGAHSDFMNRFVFPSYINKESGQQEAEARAKEISVSLPPGLLGNVNAIPTCETGELVGGMGNCPIDSQVGITEVTVSGLGKINEPVFNMEPPHPEGEIARFGFIGHSYPVFVDVAVNTAGDYSATATVHTAPGQAALLRAKTTLWGNPPDPAHDKQRFNPLEAGLCGGACPPEGNPSGLPPTAFFSNPSACQPMPVGLEVKSYQRPGELFTASTEMEPITDCSGLPFAPTFEAQASNPTPGAPTGLKTTLVIPQQSTEAVNSPSTATMKEARVTLPPGFQINASAADGIASCDEGQIGYHEEVDEACPDASKVGVAQIQSPLLPHPIGAEIFLRNQRPGHPFGLWLASDELGLHVKIPGDLEPDKGTGQLSAIFTDLPQTPVSEIDLNVWGGPRAPLQAPEACGTYNATWSFKPHSDDPAVSGTSPITVDQGCGARPFSPALHAGTTNPVAGAYSPFEFDLQQAEGEQNLASLDLTLPDGLLAKLNGVLLCLEAVVDSGYCPAESKIGTVIARAGSGPYPLWIPQPGRSQPAVYLSGPYKGAPFSIAAVVPAQAGPFDLGNVVVRSALRVDPETARATVASDPLPQFFEGVGVTYRRIHVVVDRPEFTINPTDCSELAITSRLSSNQGAVATPKARFQVDGCKALAYTPKLVMALKGGTKRSGHPALKATLTQPPHQANTAKATVVLPASEFIDQDHINNPCTRVQFKEDRCPKLSILGKVTATTPLLDQPLKGNVYFRSNGGERELPDIVADLRGQIHATIVGWVDSVPVKGTELSRLRTRFATVPDAPVSKFQIALFGGKKKGLLENSRNLCLTNRRAKVSFTAQNGRQSNRNLLIKTSCSKKKR